MQTHELLGTREHHVWGNEFCRVAAEINFDPADPEHADWVAAWMANAMVKGDDDRRNAIESSSWLYRTELKVRAEWSEFKHRIKMYLRPRPHPIVAE